MVGVGFESAIQLENPSFPSILCVYELAALRKYPFLLAMPTYYGGLEASVLAQVQVQVQVQVEIADRPEIMAGVISYSEDSR